MLKNRIIKITACSLVFMLALSLAVPKLHLAHLSRPNQAALMSNPEAKVETPQEEDVDLQQYNKPVYFNIFKFISSFLPLKPRNTIQKVEKILNFSAAGFNFSLIGRTPVSE